MATDVEVVKNGETCMQADLQRSALGLSITVRTLPRVEEFFSNLSGGRTVDVGTLGRHWINPSKDKKKLLVYTYDEKIPQVHVERAGFSFRLDKPGQPLTELGLGGEFAAPDLAAGPQVNEVLNLSFLRLAGISDASGVTFAVRGVYTERGVEKLAEKIEQGFSRFYREFLKPYRCIITVSTMPIKE